MAKATMKRCIFIFCLLSIAFCIGAAYAPSQAVAQTTYNLNIIFQRGIPDTSLRYWGAAIAGMGDVNGDGYDDVAVGCFKTTGALETDTAYVYIYYGGAAGIDTIHDLLIKDWAKGWNGLSICGGDINKDGYSDIIINPVSSGKAYIHYGGSSPPPTADIVFGGRLYETFTTVACGDVTGDDTTDLIVGDYANLSGDGHVNIYKGSAALDTMPWLRIDGHDGEEFGVTVGGGGNVNNDGFQDIYIGACANSEAYGWAGRLYIYHGGPAMDTIPDFIKDGEGGSQFWGDNPSALCLNNIGYGRFFTGSYYYPGGWLSAKNNGKVELFYGGSPMDSIPDMSIIGADTFTRLGTYCASALVDNGGLGDLLCGAFEDSGRGEGRLWTGKTVQDTVINAWLKGRWEGDNLGVKVANAGDVDKNGREEIIFASAADTNRQVVICRYTGPDGVAENPFETISLPGLKLFENVPNPFSRSTTIRYQLMANGFVSLRVYNIQGQLVRVLANEVKNPGSYEVRWDGRDETGQTAANGIYFYQLKTGDKSMVEKKMILIK